MNSNDVQLVRVYTRKKEGTILEITIPSNGDFEVVVEAEAGAALFSSGGTYEIRIFVRDLTDNTVIVHKATLGSGNFGDENWPEYALEHPFLISPQGTQKEGHVYEVIATLTAGVVKPNVSFVKSPMFIICKS